jgi:hypothetical protein
LAEAKGVATLFMQVGWIFTDLESEGNGTVAYKRNVVNIIECVPH